MRRTGIELRFLLLTLAWLVPAFGLWYLTAPYLLMPVAAAADGILTGWLPHLISGVEQHGLSFEVLLQVFKAADPALPPGAQMQAAFTLNPLKYAYGWPLLLALTLATPTRLRRKLLAAAIGLTLVIAIPIWGVVCEALKVLVFNTEPGISAQVGTTALTRELLAIAYQLGYLIFPALLPILIWAGLHRDFLRTWSARRTAAEAAG